MQIDVFTLFPHWFDWFVDQRHVRGSGARIDLVDFREGTPLSGGQVDDFDPVAPREQGTE